MVKHLTLIFLSLFFLSCGARKVSISKSYSETKIDSVVSEKKETESIQQNAVSIKEDIDEIELVPIDSTKPIVVDGKEYFNTTIRIKKTKRELVDTSKSVSKTLVQKDTKVNKEEKQKSFIKSVDKKPNYFFVWVILILFGVFVAKRYIIK
jgi:hypothetical protein